MPTKQRARRRRRLTDAQVRGLRAPGDHAVGGVPGLFLRVRGGARTFRLRYRTPTGTMRNVNLGAYPSEISLALARDRAAEIRLAVRSGRDPAAERKAEREAMRMHDLFGETSPDDKRRDKSCGWYLGTYVQTAGRLGKAKTAKGIANDRSAIAMYVRTRKSLMRKRVADVKPGDLNLIKAAAPASTWRKLRNVLLVCFRHAEEAGAIAAGTNPALRTKAAADAKRERFLTPEERQRLMVVLERADEIGPSTKAIPRGESAGLSAHLVRVLRLLILTGMRRGEALALRWQDVDWRNGVLRLPTSKTGRREVPLTPQALAFLRAERKRGGTTRATGLVCATSTGNPVHPNNISRAWETVRKGAKLDGSDGKSAVRLHDIRHSWASDAVSAGVPLYIVGRALGHSQPNTTARYAHLHDEAVRSGLAVAGDAIERASRVEGSAKSAGTADNVEKLPRRRREAKGR